VARLPQLAQLYAENGHGLRLLSIADLDQLPAWDTEAVCPCARRKPRLPSRPSAPSRRSAIRNELRMAASTWDCKGNPGQAHRPCLVRVHSECLTGDAFGSLRCDCVPSSKRGPAHDRSGRRGVVSVYLARRARHRLINKLKAYSLPGTAAASTRGGSQRAARLCGRILRNYGSGARFLSDLGGAATGGLITTTRARSPGWGGYGASRSKTVVA